MPTRFLAMSLAIGLLVGCDDSMLAPPPAAPPAPTPQTQTVSAWILSVKAPDRVVAGAPFNLVAQVRPEQSTDMVDASGFRAEVTAKTHVVRVTGHVTRSLYASAGFNPCGGPPPAPKASPSETTVRIPLTLPPGTYSVQIPDFNHPQVATRSLVVN
jgi:hypothetical protein